MVKTSFMRSSSSTTPTRQLSNCSDLILIKVLLQNHCIHKMFSCQFNLLSKVLFAHSCLSLSVFPENLRHCTIPVPRPRTALESGQEKDPERLFYTHNVDDVNDLFTLHK